MLRRYAFIASLPLVLAAGACTQFLNNAPPALPPYIHKIAVKPFSNHTQQYGLEDRLTLAVQAEFNRDGRYQITNENQADGVVQGDITRYILEPLSYDSNHVPTEYKLSIEVKVSFFDVVKSTSMWTEPDMRGELRYFVASSGFAGSLTEDDARSTIFDILSRDIRTRTLEGLGGQSASEKTFDLKPSTAPSHGQPPDNGPPPMPDKKPRAPPPAIPY